MEPTTTPYIVVICESPAEGNEAIDLLPSPYPGHRMTVFAANGSEQERQDWLQEQELGEYLVLLIPRPPEQHNGNAH